MREFMLLVGQIFLISCTQSILELFTNLSEKTHQGKILGIACFMGSLYLLLQFVFNHLFPQVAQIVQIHF